jgi:ergothioneine biosynthesis protein EgtB
MPLKRPNTAASSTPSALAPRFRAVRAATVGLAAPLALEDQVVQPCVEASPTKWHLAHTTWFFEHFVLRAHAPRYTPVDDRYERLFNSYYQTVGEMHPRAERGALSRPTVEQIHDYRSRIDDAVSELLEARPDDPPLAAVVELGLHHEQQHQELLLTDAKQVLFANPLDVEYRAAAPPRGLPSVPLEFKVQPSGFAEIGADSSGFAFDNERPRHREWLEGHLLANRLVTNAEYREFIRAKGYSTPDLWLADGWTAVRTRGWNRPLCWSADLAREYTLAGWRPLDEHAPVCHVSFYEAAAFAAWSGARLPTETEWENAAQAVTPVQGNLLDTGWLHPAPATALPAADAGRFRQCWGDVWEWCNSAYQPYPRFRALPGSLGEYNGKFMCNQWVARGGSCVTPADHVRASYRNFFYAHDRWQFLGIRLAKDA